MGKQTATVEVLLIDDDIGDIDLTREILGESQYKFNLSAVQSGEEAFRFLEQTGKYVHSPKPNLILLDLNMPRMNGIEVLQTLKHNSRFRKIPVVILTTSQDEDDIARTYIMGAGSFITKPISLPEFEKIIGSLDTFWFTVINSNGD